MGEIQIGLFTAILLLPSVVAGKYNGERAGWLSYGTLLGLATVALTFAAPAKSDRVGFIGVSVVSALVCTFVLWSAARAKAGQIAAEAEAVRRGIRVEFVERDAPIQTESGKPVRYKLESCTQTKLSLRRTGTGSLGDWSFLMRPGGEGIAYDDWLCFRAVAGDAPPEMKAILAQIVAEPLEWFLEFEGSRHDVSVFWDDAPPGGKHAEQVFDWLEQLSRF